MGRTGPRLVPFIQNGLTNKKYRNLIAEDSENLIFSIVMPHKTKNLDSEDELFFKDWYALNNKKYIFSSKHYTGAKQAISASLRKSDYVQKVHVSDDKLTYRILSKAEVKETKRLKKEMKKANEVKKEAPNIDDHLSAGESGYGSGVDSPPPNDHALVPFLSSNNEAPQAFYTMEANTMFERNDEQQITSSGKLDDILKIEPMDTNISVKNSLLDPEYFTNIQPFADNCTSTDNFPESERVDAMKCTNENPESYSSGFIQDLPDENGCDLLQLDNLSNEDMNKVLSEDFPAFNLTPPSGCEGSVNHSTDIQNLPSELDDILTEEFLNFLDEVPGLDNQPSVPVEGDINEHISLSMGAELSDLKKEASKKIYLCKKCVHLGKTLVLFCEPQFETSSLETPGEFQLMFDELTWKEINGPRSVKDFQFINDHLMVILEPEED